MTVRTGSRARAQRPAAVLAGVVLVVVLIVSGCSPSTPSAAPEPATPLPASTSVSSPSTTTSTSTTTATDQPSAAATSSAAPVSALPAKERLAGLRSTKVVGKGNGRLAVVPGRSAAPGKGKVYRVRVEVEKGLDVDRAAFARYVMTTLNDRRSWTEKGRRRFARTDGSADIRVVLASPQTSAQICLPLRTFGKLSCREGSAAVLTMYRWVKAIPEYADNHDGYRHYVVNHEVGHALGHAHEYCAGKGRMAPVMMQQTKGLKGCRPNPWPHP